MAVEKSFWSNAFARLRTFADRRMSSTSASGYARPVRVFCRQQSRALYNVPFMPLLSTAAQELTPLVAAFRAALRSAASEAHGLVGNSTPTVAALSLADGS